MPTSYRVSLSDESNRAEAPSAIGRKNSISVESPRSAAAMMRSKTALARSRGVIPLMSGAGAAAGNAVAGGGEVFESRPTRAAHTRAIIAISAAAAIHPGWVPAGLAAPRSRLPMGLPQT